MANNTAEAKAAQDAQTNKERNNAKTIEELETLKQELSNSDTKTNDNNDSGEEAEAAEGAKEEKPTQAPSQSPQPDAAGNDEESYDDFFKRMMGMLEPLANNITQLAGNAAAKPVKEQIKSLETAKGKLESAEAKRDDLEGKLEEKQAELAGHENSLEKATTQLEQKTKELGQAINSQAKYNHVFGKDETTKPVADEKQLETKISELKLEIKQLKTTVSTHKEASDSCKKEVTALKTDLTAAKQEVKGAQTHLKAELNKGLSVSADVLKHTLKNPGKQLKDAVKRQKELKKESKTHLLDSTVNSAQKNYDEVKKRSENSPDNNQLKKEALEAKVDLTGAKLKQAENIPLKESGRKEKLANAIKAHKTAKTEYENAPEQGPKAQPNPQPRQKKETSYSQKPSTENTENETLADNNLFAL